VARKASASLEKNRGPLYAVAAQVAALRKRAKALGVFSHDRELLECRGCGLMEDVTAEGTLITCRAKTPGRDTGLSFRELRGNRFRCPECGLILGRTDSSCP
jgi:hypothetical protein